LTYLDKIREKRLESSNKLAQQEAQEHQTNVADKNGTLVAATIKAENLRSRGNTQNVKVTNQDLAKTGDIKELSGHIEKLGETLKPESIDWQPVRESLSELAEQLKELPRTFPEIPKPVDSVTVKNQIDIEPTLKNIQNAIENLKLAPVFDPKIVVKPAEVKITEKETDITPVVESVKSLIPVLESLKVVTEKKNNSELLEAINKTTGAINSIRFPIPNYVLPFRQDGKATQVSLDSSGALPVTFSSSTYKLILDETTTTSVTYVGKAALGSATSAAVWQIQKIDESSGLVITWGGTGAFDQVYDNRATTVVYA